MILVTGQFFGCRKIHYLCVLQEPNKISDYHYYLPTQELATDLYIASFLSFVSGGTHASLCLSHTVFSVFAFLSPFPFLSLLLTLSYLLCPAGWWSGGSEDGAPFLNPALLALVGSEAWLPRGDLWAGSAVGAVLRREVGKGSLVTEA